MGKDVIEILEDKGTFIRAVEAMLYADGNNMVDSLAYGVELQPGDDECCDEYVSVIYTDGLARRKLKLNNYYKTCPLPKPQSSKKKKLCNGWKDKPNRYCHYHGTPYAERHEVFGGANRQTSIKYGFQVDVCPTCHRELETNITTWAQEQNQKWAEVYQTAYMADLESAGITRDQALDMWMSLIGQNYLEECEPK